MLPLARLREPWSTCTGPVASEWLSVEESRGFGYSEMERCQPASGCSGASQGHSHFGFCQPSASSSLGHAQQIPLGTSKFKVVCAAMVPPPFWVRGPVTPPGSPSAPPPTPGRVGATFRIPNTRQPQVLALVQLRCLVLVLTAFF